MNTLSRSLIETAVNRGHGPFRRSRMTSNYSNRVIQSYYCTKCGMEATADTQPPPNGIDIGGEMMALNCTGQYDDE